MKKVLFGFVVMAICIIGMTGCNSFTTENSVIAGAIDVATDVLTSDGSQALAIAAANSWIKDNIEDETQQQLAQQAVNAMIPAIADAIKNSNSKEEAEKKIELIKYKAIKSIK